MTVSLMFAVRILLFSLIFVSTVTNADEFRPAYIQITEIAPGTYETFWKVPARGSNQRLPLRLEFGTEVERSEPTVDNFVDGAHVQRFTIRREGGLTGARISINGLVVTSTETVLRIENLDGTSIMHRLTPDAPEYVVEPSPTLGQIVWTYLVLGVEHILIGIDHLLFVLVLLMLVQSVPKLVLTITAFTVAHSITLSLAALDLIRVPVPPVEACIALSIVFVATEIIHGYQGRPGLTARRPWIVAFTFGLLHGLGFAAALGEIGLPQTAIPQALLFFNVGVEIGQLIFVGGVLAVLWLIRKLKLEFGEHWRLVPPYVIGSLASFWVVERTMGYLI